MGTAFHGSLVAPSDHYSVFSAAPPNRGPLPIVPRPHFFTFDDVAREEGDRSDSVCNNASVDSLFHVHLYLSSGTTLLPVSRLPETTKRDRLMTYRRNGTTFYGISVVDKETSTHFGTEKTETQLRDILKCQDNASVNQRLLKEVASDLNLDKSRVISEKVSFAIEDQDRNCKGEVTWWSHRKPGTGIYDPDTKYFITLTTFGQNDAGETYRSRYAELAISLEEFEEFAKYFHTPREVFARVQGYESASSVGLSGSVSIPGEGEVSWETSPVKDRNTGENGYTVIMPSRFSYWITEKELQSRSDRITRDYPKQPRNLNCNQAILDDIHDKTQKASTQLLKAQLKKKIKSFIK